MNPWLTGVLWVALTAPVTQPCQDVVARADAAGDPHAAERILGHCLAAPGTAADRLHAVLALIRLSADRGDMANACQQTARLQLMLEEPIPGIEAQARSAFDHAVRQHGCRCDRAWTLGHVAHPWQAPADGTRTVAPSWFDEGIDQRLIHISRGMVAGESIEVLVNTRRGMDHLCVFRDGTPAFAESRGAVSSGFESVETFHRQPGPGTMAVIRWRAGAHGEALQIVDLGAGAAVLERRSSWPVAYTISDGRVDYVIHTERDGQGGFQAIEGRY
ncbi:hypothetical protein B1C78_08910 [Thioalkalivibrio denitrificans]|uniref:Uncharacterized protein n=1 Tax=Thioalkalivibrio denitrificans TaxID=108003 RepID=A0A1V3NGV6_9GAMM|nr:hypothetical protein [Thioalkalivibrio denitrificans]OOG24327.1 hypothetical protein B1C78_08910 [Thioalkalivibrio denitrificans]